MALKYASSKYLDYSGALQVIGDIPLDIRNVVSVESDLITASTWYKNGSDSTTSIAYTGMLVSVAETGDVYICTNASAPTSLTSWKKLASASDISGLSGVFQFKGMAYAISPDSSYILLNNGTFDLTPIGTACDMIGNTYFGWSIDSTEIWTAGPLWENAVKYTKSKTSTTVYGMTIDGTLYFVSSTQPKPDAGILLESLDGRYVFFDKWLGSLESAFTDFNPIGVPICDLEGTCTDTIVSGYIFKYDAYTFTEAEVQANISFYVAPLLASDGTKTDGDGNKIPNNSGHVYQIGENEYASNGTIWVKLGSPVEDWIIL